jgi:hypothetical protein
MGRKAPIFLLGRSMLRKLSIRAKLLVISLTTIVVALGVAGTVFSALDATTFLAQARAARSCSPSC